MMSERWQVVMVFLYLWVEGSWHCRISEYRCKTVPQCIRLDQVCDRVAHCSDASDEPDGCSVCNKTYYGDVGKTYRLSVTQPPMDQLPFTCRMHFAAAHYELGDIVKLTLEKFRIGHFQSPLHDGCPDGALKITDGNRFYGGQYCGSLNKLQMKPIYISETTSLTAELKLMRISSPKLSREESFAFDVAYQFLPKSDTMIRYQKESDTGVLRAQKGVSCSYEFTNCLSKECHLQSPNYPGMYPRNLTCSYHVKVRRDEVPTGHFASITLYQQPQYKADLQPSLVNVGRGSSSKCETPGDQITMYDGSHPNDPVLVQLCLNRGEIPTVTSSGSSILLVFRSVPYAVPVMGALSTHGFEMKVKVHVRPLDSFSKSKLDLRDPQQQQQKNQPQLCQFQIDSDNGSKGTLGSAAHSLPANSSCQYNFVGKPHERVWITFTRFSSPSSHGFRNGPFGACASNHLVLIDSDREIGKFCHSNPPKLCEHSLLSSEYLNQTMGTFRPCHIQSESYVSKSATFSIVQVMKQGSVIEPVDFSLLFEFVQETSAQKTPLNTSTTTSLSLTILEDPRNQSCHFVFLGSKLKNKSVYSIPSPRNVFLFGRGGAPNLTCTYEFIGTPGQRVMLLLKEMVEGPPALESSCRQISNPLMRGRSACQMREHYAVRGASGSFLLVGDQFEPSSLFVRSECFCAPTINNLTPRRITSNSSSLRLEYHIHNMNSLHDFTHFHFKAQFIFVQQDRCSSSKVIRETGGQVILDISDPCHHKPWLFDFARLDGAQMFMKCQGHLVGTYDHVVIFRNPKNLTTVKECKTPHKIIIWADSTTYIVCPMVQQSGNGISSVDVILPPLAVVQLISDGKTDAKSQDLGIYQIHWLLLFPQSSLANNVQSNTTSSSSSSSSSSLADPSSGLVSRSSDAGQMSSACAFACPELLSAGCIDATLWCDGIAHCPSGFDESEDNCRHVFVPILYTYCLSAFIILVLALIGFVVVQRCRHFQQQNAVSHLHNPFIASSAQITSTDLRHQCNDNPKLNSRNSITNLTQDYLICSQGIS